MRESGAAACGGPTIFTHASLGQDSGCQSRSVGAPMPRVPPQNHPMAQKTPPEVAPCAANLPFREA